MENENETKSDVCRSYELQVNGGTPYEKDIFVETSTSRKCERKQKTNFTKSHLIKMR